jgi:hypothetical protein
MAWDGMACVDDRVDCVCETAQGERALEAPMRRIVHPTPHPARHRPVFTRHPPASSAACNRHAAAHRPIENSWPRYFATCVTHAALAYTTVQ